MILLAMTLALKENRAGTGLAIFAQHSFILLAAFGSGHMLRRWCVPLQQQICSDIQATLPQEITMKPKNLLFIISDQHNRDALGCYGHPFVQTPNLDALAARGTRFTSAYTNCPICVPARASLATGRYVHQTGHWDNAFPYSGEPPGWGHRLIDAGHRVESIGKLHFRDSNDTDGFQQHEIPLNVVDGIGDLRGCIRDNAPSRIGMRQGVVKAGPGDSTYIDYDVNIADHTEQWLQRQADNPDSQPWVLFASFVCPHPPYVAPPELYDMYPLDQIPLPVQSRPDERPDHPSIAETRRVMNWEQPLAEEEIRRMAAAYYGCCTHLDRQVGRVLAALEASGLTDSTRVLYTTDHGESMGRRGLWGKFTMYEESAAIPLILAGSDVPRGHVTDDPVTLVDCYQTILQCAGISLNEVEQQLPGSSLWPIAAGEQLDRAAFSEYHAVATRSASYMLRRGKMKYIHYIGDRPQLFDLEADPDETNDLAEVPAFATVLAELEAELRTILDPEAVDARAKADQQARIEEFGGREAVLARGTFTNSPAPGETPIFIVDDESP
ncbi:MAG TPA: sulfatase-like hydrolase/transferase [Pirellulaceae bacterium]|nr:sulfatase-like hydrolase/transferase [Pirellulaceae bacterium]